jgi:amino acid adenylation domain-containing protein/thioester reductase-like protein
MSRIGTSRCLHELIVAQARRTPDALAVVDAAQRLTYAELDRRSDELAAHLRAHGVGPDQLVGVLMERCADYLVTSLAALKAGGAFLVLELAYPDALLADVLADARPRVVVTMAAHADRLDPSQARIVLDDLPSDPVPAVPDDAGRPTPASLAFVSYSSGTTGRPKGIANPHRAAVRSYAWRFELCDQGPGDRVACNVFFIWEMLRPLLRGGTVVVIGDDVIYDPVALVTFLREQRATEVLMTPSLLETVLGRIGADLGAMLPDLRVLWLNGEVVTRVLARSVLRALPDTRVLNVYSASESHEIAAGDLRELVEVDTTFCPVGPAMDPEHTYVLDDEGRRVPDGVDGELHVGGGCLASHYLNLPDETAAAFVPDPFAGDPDARMYRTGDRARMLDGGVLEITGRVGSMVKIRGYSVEPGAVEAAIDRTLAVSASVVVAHGDDGGGRHLVAYLVRDHAPGDDRVADWQVDATGRSPTVRRELAARLPHYMVPAVYVELAAVPVDATSGKIATDRLPDPPEQAVSAAVDEVPAGADVTRADLARLWSTVLELDPTAIGADDDFFDLGGHSLGVAELGARVADAFGVEVPLPQLVARSTLADHRRLVAAARRGEPEAEPDLDLRAEAVLGDDITPARDRADRSLVDSRWVLLTGATGFLGGHLLDRMLRDTRTRVACLVRGGGDRDARPAEARLRASLERRGLWRNGHEHRLVAVAGDLGRHRLGLPDETYDELADRVDAVVHAGAAVNLQYPYAALRGVNVDGTREVLRLASRRATPVHHVSTNGVLPHAGDPWDEHAPLDAAAGALADGYGQSKWVAEQLVHQAADRGLPVRIYRPGTISGHSATGRANARDLLGALIVESLRLGVAPDVEGWYPEMMPVDFVSRALCSLASDPDPGQRVFHLADPDPLPAPVLFDRFEQLGYRLRRVGWAEWAGVWRARRARETGVAPADVLRGGMPTEDDLRAVPVLDDPLTRPHLHRHGVWRPRIDTSLLAAYSSHFHAEGWLERAPVRAGAAR